MEKEKKIKVIDNSSSQMALFTEKFNANPSSGIKYLLDEKIIGDDPDSLAFFLYQSKDLNPEAVGIYLATSLKKSDAVGKAYLSQLPLNAIEVDDALRELCKRLKLPSESQQIDTILENLAAAYIEANPAANSDTTSVYTLFFALLMLNTDAHNHVIPASQKMTKSQFLKLSQGACKGFDENQIGKLYDKILANKICV